METLPFYLQTFCRSAVILIFTISFLGKVRQTTVFQQTITNFALFSEKFSRLLAYALLFAEVCVVILLLLGDSFLLTGFLLATLLLGMFCLALLSVLIRRITTTCPCFGPTRQPVSAIDIVRNIAFIVCTLGGCITLFNADYSQRHLNLAAWGIIAASALVFVIIWTQIGEIAQFLRHH